MHSMGSLGEALPELEGGYHEALGESESAIHEHHEGEAEAEQFFGGLARLAARAVKSPAFRSLAATAAKSALSGLGSLLGDSEYESEDEAEFEDELSPIRRVYADAMMEHLGSSAAEAESEVAARRHVRAMVPLAARVAPQAAPVIRRAASGLAHGATRVLHTLHRSPTTRPLVRAIPTILRGTAVNLARQVAAGHRVTPQGAVRQLARQTARVLGNPHIGVQAYRRSRWLDRRYHALAARRPGLMRSLQAGVASHPGYRSIPGYVHRGLPVVRGVPSPVSRGVGGMPADLVGAGASPGPGYRRRGYGYGRHRGCGCCCCCGR
jgi:hypothetical protein